MRLVLNLVLFVITVSLISCYRIEDSPKLERTNLASGQARVTPNEKVAEEENKDSEAETTGQTEAETTGQTEAETTGQTEAETTGQTEAETAGETEEALFPISLDHSLSPLIFRSSDSQKIEIFYENSGSFDFFCLLLRNSLNYKQRRETSFNSKNKTQKRRASL